MTPTWCAKHLDLLQISNSFLSHWSLPTWLQLKHANMFLCTTVSWMEARKTGSRACGSFPLSVGPSTWESLGNTWIPSPTCSALLGVVNPGLGWHRKGYVELSWACFQVVHCSYPRMSGDVSSQVFHLLASYLRPACWIRHTLHWGLLPWQNELPGSSEQGAQYQLAPRRVDEGAQVTIAGWPGLRQVLAWKVTSHLHFW
jgi:hypothetical protein